MNIGVVLPEFERITGQFSNHFEDLGFKAHPPAGITSGIDPSVRLIGAPISVLKPYLEQQELLEEGRYIAQNCIRTHNLKSLFELDEPQEYGSFFTGLGALASAEQVGLLFQATSDLLRDRLGVRNDEAFISVSSEDEDLLKAAENNGCYAVRPDFMDPPYYRHVYGIDGVAGRNTSYWVVNRATGEYEDIGNVIAIEGLGIQYGIEFAFGDTTLVKQLSGLSHVTDAYNLQLVEQGVPNNVRIRFEDCVITSMALFAEGLKPSAHNNQTRILRTYMKGISLFRRLLDIDATTLEDKLEFYEEGYLPFTATGAGKFIVSWTVEYENDTAENGASNKEDTAVLSVLETWGKES